MEMRSARNKETNRSFNVKVKINPLPRSCYECPFFYITNPEDEGTWYETWDCYLKSLDDYYGIALNRHPHCPL